MWLLNTGTISLEHFEDDREIEGRYAILSHTWGNDEVTFDTVHLESVKRGHGYAKILATCRQALTDGLKYAWVDTCCIDKRSSAELSEAINSMYRWYYNAAICYAYLSDLMPEESSILARTRLQNCRWFTRGWTLQELIAPRALVFHDASWTRFATRSEVADAIAYISHVDKDVLLDREKLWQTSVAKRMSWASMRTTTRVEDVAYSLLGIYDIKMPLLYGEGPEAFKTLQEEIIRTWTQVDHSILAWDGDSDGLLASTPAHLTVHFPNQSGGSRLTGDDAKRNIISWPTMQNETFELSNRGLRITLYARAVSSNLADELMYSRFHVDKAEELDLGAPQSARLLVALNCTYSKATHKMFAMYLTRRPWIKFGPHESTTTNHHDYAMYDFEARYTTVLASQLGSFTLTTLTIARKRLTWKKQPRISVLCNSTGYKVAATEPEHMWTTSGNWYFINEEVGQHEPAMPYILLDHDPPQSSRLSLRCRAHMEYTDFSLDVTIEVLGRSRVFKRPPTGLTRPMRDGETYTFRNFDQNVLTVTAKIEQHADELIWVLAVTDPGLNI